MSNENLLHSTRAFWDANPCGIHADYETQRRQRYLMESWVPPLLGRIAATHRTILEVGCGQGVDSIELCRLMHGGSYIGIDYSPKSIETAAANASQIHDLGVRPSYEVGNAEALRFDDAKFDAVYSMGVLHHTVDERRAIDEVHRVLQPGGTAYICLYRSPAPKIVGAKILRGLQRALDTVFRTDRCVYEWLRRRSTSHPMFGTMFHECFGVPYLKSYRRREILRLFGGFARVTATPIGTNFGRLVAPSEAPSLMGHFWLIEAHKA